MFEMLNGHIIVKRMSGIVDSCFVQDFLRSQFNENVEGEYLNLLKHAYLSDTVPPFWNSQSEEMSQEIFTYIGKVGRQTAILELREMLPELSEIEHLTEMVSKQGTGSKSLLNYSRARTPVLISYKQYKELKEQSSQQLQRMLTSKLFLNLCNKTTRNVSMERLVKHLKLTRNCEDYYLKLVAYDTNMSGFVSEANFVEYVKSIIAELPFIDLFLDEEPHFVDFYSLYVAHKMLVIHDPLRTCSVSIESIIKDPLFLQFVGLVEWEDTQQSELDPLDAKRLIAMFYEMDTDEDGKLTKEDLLHMPTFRFSDLFIERLILTFPGEMDLVWYYRFIFAYVGLGKPWANQILFDVLDIDGNGVINEVEYHLFFYDILKDWQEVCDYPDPSYGTLASETFDMCNATNNSMTKEKFIRTLRAKSFVHNIVDLRSLVKFLHNDDAPSRNR